MPCPEENPCSEVRQSQIALQKADPGILLIALRNAGWAATPRTKGVGIFMTKPGLMAAWEPGRDIRIEGVRLERAKELAVMRYFYAYYAVYAAAKKTEWEVVCADQSETGTMLKLERAGCDHPATLWVFVYAEGHARITCPPLPADQLASAEAFLARLDTLFGTTPDVRQSSYESDTAEFENVYA